jgi:hypothetical protein
MAIRRVVFLVSLEGMHLGCDSTHWVINFFAWSIGEFAMASLYGTLKSFKRFKRTAAGQPSAAYLSARAGFVAASSFKVPWNTGSSKGPVAIVMGRGQSKVSPAE